MNGLTDTNTLDAKDFFTIAVVLLLFSSAGWLLFLLGQSVVQEKSVRSQCLASGYPEMRFDRYLLSPNKYYCHKRVSGTDTMIEVNP